MKSKFRKKLVWDGRPWPLITSACVAPAQPAAAPAAPAAAPSVIKIGAVVPLSGRFGAGGAQDQKWLRVSRRGDQQKRRH